MLLLFIIPEFYISLKGAGMDDCAKQIVILSSATETVRRLLLEVLDKQFYVQLKHRLVAYRNITIFQILEHLNTIWRPLDVQSKKKLGEEQTPHCLRETTRRRPEHAYSFGHHDLQQRHAAVPSRANHPR
jgi:hypothetical protein